MLLPVGYSYNLNFFIHKMHMLKPKVYFQTMTTHISYFGKKYQAGRHIEDISTYITLSTVARNFLAKVLWITQFLMTFRHHFKFLTADRFPEAIP